MYRVYIAKLVEKGKKDTLKVGISKSSTFRKHLSAVERAEGGGRLDKVIFVEGEKDFMSRVEEGVFDELVEIAWSGKLETSILGWKWFYAKTQEVSDSLMSHPNVGTFTGRTEFSHLYFREITDFVSP